MLCLKAKSKILLLVLFQIVGKQSSHLEHIQLNKKNFGVPHLATFIFNFSFNVIATSIQ